MTRMLMCRTCGAEGDPFAYPGSPGSWLALKHLLPVCERVAARREGKPVVLHHGDAARVWDTYYEHARITPSLDIGHGMAVVNEHGVCVSRRDLLGWMAEPGITFRRMRTIQGDPILVVDAAYSGRVAIGIGDTWTDAVARAWDMWSSGT